MFQQWSLDKCHIHLTPDSPKYIDQVVVIYYVVDRDLSYLSNATGIIQRSCHIIENELLKVKVHVKLLGYVSTGILVITISDVSYSRNCNFLTRRDLSFIFEYVVSIDMNFIYNKRSMLNFKESVAKVKSAPNFGKMTTIGIRSSLGIFSTFFIIIIRKF